MAAYTRVAYHTLDDPLHPKILPNQYSDLHTLYPGTPMSSDDNYDRYSIPHEDVDAARKQFEQNAVNNDMYQNSMERNALSSIGPKMTVNAVADPSEIIEDPNLKQVSMMPTDQTASLQQTPVFLDHKNDPDNFSGDGQSMGMLRSPIDRENFNGVKYTDITSSNKDKSFYRWLKLIILGAAAFIFIFLLVTGNLGF